MALFADLDPAVLAEVAGRLGERQVPVGTVVEEDGALSVVRRGRADVLGPGLAGQPVVVGELGPGDTFGLAAVLGGGAGTAMRAVETLTLAVLDADLLRALAQSEPSVAAGLTGRRSSIAPTGQRLSRVTFGGAGGRRLSTLDGTAAGARAIEHPVPDRPPAPEASCERPRPAVAARGAGRRHRCPGRLGHRHPGRAVDGGRVARCGAPARRDAVAHGRGGGVRGGVGPAGCPRAPPGVDLTADVEAVLGRRPTAVLVVPGATDAGTVGAVGLADKDGGGPFSVDDIELAALLGPVAAAAVAGARRDGAPSPAALAAGLRDLATANPARYRRVATAVAALLDGA